MQWLYQLHTRAIEERKYDVAKRSSLVIYEISRNSQRVEKI